MLTRIVFAIVIHACHLGRPKQAYRIVLLFWECSFNEEVGYRPWLSWRDRAGPQKVLLWWIWIALNCSGQVYNIAYKHKSWVFSGPIEMGLAEISIFADCFELKRTSSHKKTRANEYECIRFGLEITICTVPRDIKKQLTEGERMWPEYSSWLYNWKDPCRYEIFANRIKIRLVSQTWDAFILAPRTQYLKRQAGLAVLLPLSRWTGCISAADGFALPSVLWVESGTHRRWNLSLLETEVVCKLASTAAQWEQICRVKQLVQKRRCLHCTCFERLYFKLALL